MSLSTFFLLAVVSLPPSILVDILAVSPSFSSSSPFPPPSAFRGGGITLLFGGEGIPPIDTWCQKLS